MRGDESVLIVGDDVDGRESVVDTLPRCVGRPSKACGARALRPRPWSCSTTRCRGWTSPASRPSRPCSPGGPVTT